MENSSTRIDLERPQLFQPHPHLSDDLNSKIIESEIEGGVELKRLPDGAILHVRTENSLYRIHYLGSGEAMISGNQQFCPEPTLVRLSGSTWGGSVIKRGFIGRGMHLEFWKVNPNRLPLKPGETILTMKDPPRPIITSRIRDVWEVME